MSGFLFLRHGETDWNVQGRMQGQIQDVPLNANGIAQARQVADLLAGEQIDLVVSSTLDRAVMTSQIIAEKTGAPVLHDPRLIERSFGMGEGLTYDQLMLQDPDTFFTEDGRADWISDTRQPKGSETREAVGQRALAAVEDLIKTHQDKKLLLVTHGAWMRAFTFLVTGRDQIFPNTTPYTATLTNEAWDVTIFERDKVL